MALPLDIAKPPARIAPGIGPDGWSRWLFDDFVDGLKFDGRDPGGLWKPMFTNGAMTLNQEKQGYVYPGQAGKNGTRGTYDPFSIVERDGKKWLAITARKTPDAEKDATWGMPYQSGVIANWSRGNQTYGYFEATMILPEVKGVWPAFWLMNGDGPGGLPDVWPPEIDILEWPNGAQAGPTKVWVNAHWTDLGRANKRNSSGGWIDIGRSVHEPVVYGCLWTPRHISFYHDGALTRSVPNAPAAMGVHGIHLPMHAVINLAMGDPWAGPVDERKLPCALLVTDIGQWRAPA